MKAIRFTDKQTGLMTVIALDKIVYFQDRLDENACAIHLTNGDVLVFSGSARELVKGIDEAT
jgi:hypothetical protein